MTRQINDEGLKLIKQWEGLKTEAYKDIAGIWTIGYAACHQICICGFDTDRNRLWSVGFRKEDQREQCLTFFPGYLVPRRDA